MSSELVAQRGPRGFPRRAHTSGHSPPADATQKCSGVWWAGPGFSSSALPALPPAWGPLVPVSAEKAPDVSHSRSAVQ